MELGERARGHDPEGVDLGLELEQRAQQLAARPLVAEVGRLDDDHLAAAEHLGHLRDRRDLEQPAERRHVLGRVARPLGPRAEHLAGALHRPDQPPGERLGDGVERDLELGHDAEAPTAAAKRPEEVRVRLRVCAENLAVGGDDLGREHARRGEAVLARHPADPAPERVADDPHVRGRAVERGEAVLDCGVDDVDPDRPGGDARDARLDVDLDAGHPRRVDQQRAVEGSAGGAVARALDRDAKPEGARVVDGRDDVVDGLRQRDHGGALVDGEVPGLAGGIPARVARKDEDVRGGFAAGRGSGVDELCHACRLLVRRCPHAGSRRPNPGPVRLPTPAPGVNRRFSPGGEGPSRASGQRSTRGERRRAARARPSRRARPA